MADRENKKILVIGAGIAGLCTGVYALKSGFDVEIAEMNHSSGGLATSWKREGYTFENCLHWLLGSNPYSPFHVLWKEVFDIDKLQFYDAEDYIQIEMEKGQHLTIKRDLDDMERELLKFAPEDQFPILRFMKGLRRLKDCDLPLTDDGPLSNALAFLKMVPFLPEMQYWSRMSCKEFSEKFRNPLLRRFFGTGASSKMSAIGLLFALSWMSKKDAGYPIGGSRAVIDPIEQNFRNLGGRIRFNSKVDQILASNGRATGVHLTDGTAIHADWVVSAADGHSTLFDWIPLEYHDPKAEEPYRKLKVYPSYLQVSLGVNRNLSRAPGLLSRVLETPMRLDPSTLLDQMDFRIFNYDPSFAPAGKTAVTCFLPTFDDRYWTELQARDPEAYNTKKKQIARQVIEVLDRRFPGIRDDIEVRDVSTPVTVINFTGNWKGSMEGFIITPGLSYKPLAMSLPTLRNFRMVGQWVEPGGGLPSGLATARRCVQAICKSERRPFLAQEAKALRKTVLRPQALHQ